MKQNALGSAIPAAASMFSGSGMINSSTAMDGVGRAAMDAVAPYEYQAHDTAQNRAMQAAQMLPGLDQAMYNPYLMQSQVGAQQDTMAQAEIDAAMKKYYEGEGQAAANFSPYLNAIMGLGGMGGTSSTTSPQQGTGLGPAIMGGLGTYGALAGIPGISGGMAGLGGLLGALAGLSDRRTKEDIQRIGTTDGGTPIYRVQISGNRQLHDRRHGRRGAVGGQGPDQRLRSGRLREGGMMPGRLPAQNTQPRQPFWPAVETGADFGGAAVFGDGGWLFQRARALRLSGSGHRRDAGDAEAEARRGGGSGSHCGLCRSCAGRHGACGHVHQGRDVKWRRLCSCAHRPVQPGCHRRRHDDRAGARQ